MNPPPTRSTTLLREWRFRSEYALVRLALPVFDAIPFRVSLGRARGLADSAFVLLPERRRIAVENLLASGLVSDRHAAVRVARDSMRHFAMLVVESLRSAEWLEGSGGGTPLQWDLPPEVRALLEKEGQGLILASGHFGNWELAAQAISAFKPVAGITRPFSNPYVDAVMQKRKPRYRFRIIPKHDADMVRFLKVVREGDILAFMIDQHAGPRGMVVPFLGRPASTHTVVALLHLVTGAPLVFGYGLRRGPGRFSLHAGTPVQVSRSGRREDDVRAVLLALNGQLETVIRAHPEQYLWAHRRWRPEDAERAARA